MTDPARPVGDMQAVQLSLNCCRTLVEKLLRTDPNFPQPITIGNKRQWFLDEIEEFKATRPRRIYTTVVAVIAVFSIVSATLFHGLWV